MTADLRGFDASQVEPDQGLEPLPAGRYQAVIVASEMKDTRSGDGQYLELEFEVVDGDHKGRRFWDRLSLFHANHVAVRIAKGRLSALCRACGVLTPQDSAELHDIPITVRLKLRRRADTDELQNQVAGYERHGVLQGQPLQATSDTPPWSR